MNENIERLNIIEKKYKEGKIDIVDLVNGCYNIGLDAAKKVVKHYASLPDDVGGLFDAKLMNRIRASQTDAEARRLIMSAINKR